MLIRLNMLMRRFKERGGYPIMYVADRMGDRHDAVVLIVDILYEERERVEAVVKEVLDLLGAHNIKVLDHKLDSFMVPFREVWRFVAMVAVNH
jgi:hypothetical protein